MIRPKLLWNIKFSYTCACVEITSIQKSFFNLVFPFYCQFQKNSIKSHHQTFVIWDVLLIFLLIKPRKRKFLSIHPDAATTRNEVVSLRSSQKATVINLDCCLLMLLRVGSCGCTLLKIFSKICKCIC